MIYNMIRRYAPYLYMICFFFNQVVKSQDLRLQDREQFSVPIWAHQDVSEEGTFLVAASQKGLKNFALCMIPRTTMQLTPLAPQKVTLNSVADQLNPLYDAKCTALALLGSSYKPVVALDTDPCSILLIDSVTSNERMSILLLDQIKDAAGNNGSSIHAMTSMAEHMIAAAVSPENGRFGDPYSGIALVSVVQETVSTIVHEKDATGKNQKKEIKKQVSTLKQIDGQTSCVQAQPRAVSFGAESVLSAPALRFTTGGDLQTVDPSVDMHWDAVLKRLYVAFSVCSGTDADSGARSIMIGRFNEKGILVFDPIVCEQVCRGTNHIIGATGASLSVHAKKVRTMHTTTGLPYLITLAGIAASHEPMQLNVYALPVVNSFEVEQGAKVVRAENQAIHGTIANEYALPIQVQAPDLKGNIRFSGRKIVDPVCHVDAMITSDDPIAQVGRGSLPGAIYDMHVHADSVYVSVANNEDEEQSGIFYSHALFDLQGTIKGWTAWTRVGGCADPVYGFGIDSKQGTCWWITGTEEHTAQAVRDTSKSKYAASIARIISRDFSVHNGGVQGLCEVAPYTTRSLAGTSFLIATGLHTMAFLRTGYKAEPHGVMIPLLDNMRAVYCDGCIPKASNVDITNVVVSGGDLKRCGALRAATIVEDEQYGYVCIGGTDGLAILIDESGKGFCNTVITGPVNLHELVIGMRYRVVGDYRHVIKVVADNDHGLLYVLTAKKLDRIRVATSDFASNLLDVTTVAQVDNMKQLSIHAGFMDVVITTDKFALLATTQGLFRVGNDGDIADATCASEIGWTAVTIPGHIQAVHALLSRSPDGNPLHVARDGGGHIYVLVGSHSLNQSQLYRYTVADVHERAIDDATFVSIPDIMVSGIPDVDENGNLQSSYFQRYGEYRHMFATDGQLCFTARNADHECGAKVYNRSLRNQYSLSIDPNIKSIYALIQETSLGHWLLATDHGVSVLPMSIASMSSTKQK